MTFKGMKSGYREFLGLLSFKLHPTIETTQGKIKKGVYSA